MKPNGIWGNIFHPKRKEGSLADVLHHIGLFSDLSAKELGILEHVVHRRTYEQGETVFVETELGAGMYVILSGRVDIVLRHKSDNPLPLADLKSGDFFGEMALLGDTHRSASAIVRERADLIGFFHPDLLELMKLHPQIGAKIAFGLARTIAERLRFTDAQLRETREARGQHETAGR